MSKKDKWYKYVNGYYVGSSKLNPFYYAWFRRFAYWLRPNFGRMPTKEIKTCKRDYAIIHLPEGEKICLSSSKGNKNNSITKMLGVIEP